MEEIQATYLADRHRVNDWTIIHCETDEGPVAIKTYCQPEDLQTGVTYSFYGTWNNHSTFGQQFNAKSFTRTRPHGRSGVVWALTTVAGIGPRIATRIFDTCGPGAIDELMEDPHAVAATVTGLSTTVAVAAADHFRNEVKITDAEIELRDLLDGVRCPKRKVITQCLKLWGNRAPDVIREDPFLLADRIRGVGFHGADTLWHKLGHDPTDIRRQWRAVVHTLTVNTDSVWHSIESVHQALRDKIDSAKVCTREAIDTAVEEGYLTTRIVDNVEWVALCDHDFDEGTLAEIFAHATHEDGVWPSLNRVEFQELTDHQRSNMGQLRGRICHLGGSPGTGKTYCTARLIKAIVADHGEGAVAVAAFAAKAARRITQAMGENGVDVTATTIHRVLGVERRDDESDSWEFHHHADNPLEVKYLILDEASMIPAWLMRAVLESRGDAHVLLVGDVNQLLPVGAGAPLRDFINAGIPRAVFTEIIRNTGRIVSACDEIRRGVRFTTSSRIDLDSGENLILRPTSNDQALVDRIAQLMPKMADHFGADQIWDFQVIVATNDLRKRINRRLQEVLNPHGRSMGASPFRVGDKVINTQNVFRRDQATGEEVFVANGEMGAAVEVQTNHTVAQFNLPLRRVIFPRGDDNGGRLDLAYACTCHKYQGSEAPFVIVGVSANRYATSTICDRSWIYTAISRARRACVILGRREDVDVIARRNYRNARKTFLVERIGEARR